MVMKKRYGYGFASAPPLTGHVTLYRRLVKIP
jgi:hypothetical protein